MRLPQHSLPPGYRLAEYDRIDSTNAEALRCAAAGEPGGLWIVAGEQTGGRGRAGRFWVSEPGNLYATLLLRPRCSAAAAPGLSLLAAVAVYTCIEYLSAGRLSHPALSLKWPNDVLLDGAKLGGILLEGVGAPGGRDYALAIGIGLNVGQRPLDLGRAAGHINGGGREVTPAALFAALAVHMESWLQIWRDGANFAEIRAAWLKYAAKVGEPASVRLNGESLNGVFLGLDDDGALLLGDNDGNAPRRINAGDVFFGASPNF